MRSKAEMVHQHSDSSDHTLPPPAPPPLAEATYPALLQVDGGAGAGEGGGASVAGGAAVSVWEGRSEEREPNPSQVYQEVLRYMAGLWVGEYGSHGLELLYLSSGRHAVAHIDRASVSELLIVRAS